MQDFRKRLLHGTIWIGASRLLVNLAGLVSTLVLARFLVPADFGLVGIALTVTAVVTSLTELSLNAALIQHPSPLDRHFDTAFTLNLLRAVILGAVIAVLAVPVARSYHDERLTQVILFVGGTTLLSGFANPKLVSFSRILQFRQDFIINVSQRIVALGVSAAIAILYRSYWALVLGNAAAQLLAVILSYVLLPYRPRFTLAGGRDLFSFSVWLSFVQVINTVNYKFDQLVIGYVLGNASLGYYAVGDNLAALATREATAPLAQTLFPGFSRLAAERSRLIAAYQRAQSLLGLIGLPFGCGFAVVAKPFVLLAMGEKWRPAILLIQLLSGIFALQTLSSTLQPLAMAMGNTRRLFHRDLINFVIRLPLLLLGIFLGGLIGIAVARCVSGVAATILNMELARRLLGVSIADQLRVNARALAGAAVMMPGVAVESLAFATPATPLGLAAQIAILVATGASLYVGVVAGLWWAAGRPDGAEREVANLLRRILGRGSLPLSPP